MHNRAVVTLALACLLLVLTGASAGEEGERFSGFLDDYSGLEPASDEPRDLIYVAPNAFQRLADYDSIMVDQPEIFLDPDTKYKGIKPDHMKVLADAMRQAINLRSRSLEEWGQIAVNGMNQDFSWEASARRYEELYREAMADRRTEATGRESAA